MINKPTNSEMLRAVRCDLSNTIEPELKDKTLVAKVRMMGAILDAVAIRLDHEQGWMQEEIKSIITIADEAIKRLPQAKTAQAAHQNLLEDRGVEQNYQNAGELLSCLAEAAFRFDDAALKKDVTRLLHQRLEHEIAVIGDNFEAIGRG